MTDLSATLRAEVMAWLADDPDVEDRQELQAILDRRDAAELADRFSGSLTFGTAGLRGPMRAGPNGMNTAVVRRAAAGLAAHLAQAGGHGGVIVVGFDGRHRSPAFAADSAAIFAAAGFEAQVFDRALPTPVLAFAVRRLGAVAGVMVTASHNPAIDNGYKVYAGDGAQIIPPADAQITAQIAAVASVRDISLSPNAKMVDESVVRAYIGSVAALAEPGSARDLRIVHTAMHGVGAATVRSVFAGAGFPPLFEVPAQAEPDPDFPTVVFPNPEEPGAMDLALAHAVQVDADLIIANDPDADRCAVGIKTPDNRFRMLTGDEVGALLADALLQRGVTGTYATTIVSSSLLSAMAERAGMPFAETLTGFKWISRAAPDLIYGYEEALGYAVAPALVKDKDGISAAVLIAEMAAGYRARGSSLQARLDELALQYGVHATRQLSWRVADLREIDGAMGMLRASAPSTLAGHPVTITDLAPMADVLILRWDGGRVVIRPSGTEPKCKAYLEVTRAVEPGQALPEVRDNAAAELDSVAADVNRLLNF